MKNNLGTLALVDSAILTAIACVLIIIGSYTGLSVIIATLAFIPLAIIYVKYNLKFWFLGSIVTSILSFIFVGASNAVLTLIPVILYSITYAYGVRKKNGGTTTFIYFLFGNIVSIIASLAIYINLFLGVSIRTYVTNMCLEVSKLQSLYASKLPENMSNTYMSEISKIFSVQYIIILIPTAIFLYAFISSLIGCYFADNSLRRINFKVERMKEFRAWYIDAKVAAILVSVCVFGVILEQNGLSLGGEVIKATFILGLFIYIIQGLSFLCYLLTTRLNMNNSKFLPIVLIVLIYILGGVYVLFLGILGVVDFIMDVRGVNENSLMRILIGKIEEK